MKRGGAYYSTLATQLLNAHYNDLGETHVVNLPHRGAVAGWPADWVLEMPVKVNRSGITPLPAEPLPLACFGLIAQIKSYELLTVEAAVHGDRNAAYEALLAHPLGTARRPDPGGAGRYAGDESSLSAPILGVITAGSHAPRGNPVPALLRHGKQSVPCCTHAD